MRAFFRNLFVQIYVCIGRSYRSSFVHVPRVKEKEEGFLNQLIGYPMDGFVAI